MVGPDHPPASPIPEESWSQSAGAGIAAGDADLTDWWRRFNDATLDELVARAEQSNQSLAQALGNVRVAYAGVGVTESDLWPDIGLGAQYQRRKQSFAQLAAVGFEDEPFDVYEYGIGMATWEIDLWGKVRRQVEAAKADAAAQVDLLRQTLVSVRGQVASNYLQVRTLDGRIAVVRKSVANLAKIRDLTKEQVAAGTADELDLYRAQTQLELVDATLPSLLAARAGAVNAIAVLCGSGPREISAMLAAAGPIPQGPEAIGVGIPADLVRRRADVRAAEQQLIAATAGIGAAEALYLPSLTISGNFYMSATTFSGLGDWDNHAYQFGPAITVPIFTGGYIESVVNQNKAQAEAALASYRNTLLTAIGDVETAMSSLVQSRDAVVRYRGAFGSSTRAFGIAEDQYEAGVTDLTTLLDVENQLLKAEDEYVQSQGLVALDIVSLYQALGGGWEGSARDEQAMEAAHLAPVERATAERATAETTQGTAAKEVEP